MSKEEKKYLCRGCGGYCKRKVRYPNSVNNEWIYDCGCIQLAPGAEIVRL